MAPPPALASHRPLEHTADLGVEIEAPSREALFAEAAVALADTLTDVSGVDATIERELELEAAADDLLLVDFLNEILFLFETEGLVFAEAQVRLEDDRAADRSADADATAAVAASPSVRLCATLYGEAYDEAKHPLRSLVKAVTYHGLRVWREGERFEARVLFDL